MGTFWILVRLAEKRNSQKRKSIVSSRAWVRRTSFEKAAKRSNVAGDAFCSRYSMLTTVLACGSSGKSSFVSNETLAEIPASSRGLSS